MTVAFVYFDRNQIDYSDVDTPHYRECYSNRSETQERVDYLLSNGFKIVSKLPDYLALVSPIPNLEGK